MNQFVHNQKTKQMKNNILLKKLIGALFTLHSVLYFPQQQYPLNTNPFTIPANSYIKDFNNELNPYVGTWKATYNNKVYYLYVTKSLDRYRSSWKLYQDVLIIKYAVMTSDEALIINSTAGLSFSSNQYRHAIYSGGFRPIPNQNTLWFTYGGTNCGVGSGTIELSMLNLTQVKWNYEPDSTLLTDSSCPGNQDITIHLPITDNLIFTKQ